MPTSEYLSVGLIEQRWNHSKSQLNVQSIKRQSEDRKSSANFTYPRAKGEQERRRKQITQ